MVYADLKTLQLEKTWKTEALDRKQWRQKIKLLSIKANENAEMKEEDRKNVKKNTDQSNSVVSRFQCPHLGCNKTAANKAGLTNHIRQIHVSTNVQQCPISKGNFKKQGLHNHTKKCAKMISVAPTTQ